MFFTYLTTPGDIQFMNFLYFLDYIVIWSSTANNDLGANFFVVLYTFTSVLMHQQQCFGIKIDFCKKL